MPKWTEKDTAKETGAGGKQVSRAFHDARNDAAKESGWGVPKDRGGGGGDCFIATAVYGTPLVEEITFLRWFRDEYLIKTKSGRMLVAFYYRTGPSAAAIVRRSPKVKNLIRPLFALLIGCLKKYYP